MYTHARGTIDLRNQNKRRVLTIACFRPFVRRDSDIFTNRFIRVNVPPDVRRLVSSVFRFTRPIRHYISTLLDVRPHRQRAVGDC